jgi:hypothetical protein
MHESTMNRVFVALAMVVGSASPATAQAPGAELPLTAFLEKRVPEELASEGHVLSRDNLTLKVEQAGPIFVVSLVDLNTGRVAASTRVEQLPLDREAAVASVTHVAADLITQAAGREPPPPPPPPVVIDDRAERAALQVANLKFQKEAIRFAPTYDVAVIGNNIPVVSHGWQMYRGATDQVLDVEDFYGLVGRPDLAEQFQQRRKLGIGVMVAGTAIAAGGLIYMTSIKTTSDCDVTADQTVFEACLAAHDRTFHDQLTTATIVASAGLVTFLVGGYIWRTRQPLSENEIKNMAEQYNNGLRQNLGLPVVERHWFHDVHVAPYMTHSEGGLALGGRF